MHQDRCVELAREAAVDCGERHDYMPATKAVAAQAAELEALRADAERYRFLRDKAWGKDGALALLPANEMDEAVDAARAALKEQAPNAELSGPRAGMAKRGEL